MSTRLASLDLFSRPISQELTSLDIDTVKAAHCSIDWLKLTKTIKFFKNKQNKARCTECKYYYHYTRLTASFPG